jgi:pullulanase/glycogen debranching enzyme
MRAFVARVIRFRNEHPVFQRRRWFHGRRVRGVSDIGWFKPDGHEMSDQDWQAGFARTVGVFLNGKAIRIRTRAASLSSMTVLSPLQRVPRVADRRSR